METKRYDRFPQRPAPKTNIIPAEKETRLGEILSQWPKDISRSAIWDSDIRSEIQSSMPGEHTLNKRREKVSVCAYITLVASHHPNLLFL